MAKVTKCRHMFHSICLRKWLYMQVDMRAGLSSGLTELSQDNCPMCHEKLYLSKKTSQGGAPPPAEEEEIVDTEDDNDSDVTVDFTDSEEDEADAE